jgi:hypothetical protein
MCSLRDSATAAHCLHSIRDPQPATSAMSNEPQDASRAASLIPGAYERNTLTYRQLGSMGASPSDAMPASHSAMDAATIAEREREGGGAPSQRRRRSESSGSTGPTYRDATPDRSSRIGGDSWFQKLRFARH